jgi:hypothetical protein
MPGASAPAGATSSPKGIAAAGCSIKGRDRTGTATLANSLDFIDNLIDMAFSFSSVSSRASIFASEGGLWRRLNCICLKFVPFEAKQQRST